MKNKSEKKPQKRQNAKEFFRGFWITMLIMLPVFVGMQLVISHGRNNEAQNVLDPVGDLTIKAASYNLLWVLEESGSKNLLSVALVRFDTVNYRAVVCSIPDTTVLLESRAPITVRNLYSQRSVLGIKNALQETLGIPIDGYIAFATDTFETLVEKLGPFEYTLDKELVVKNTEGLTIYTKQAGNVTMDGNDIAKLLTFGNYEKEDRARLHEGLWQAALQKYGDTQLGDQLVNIYGSLVNRLATDINTAGMYRLAAAVSAACADHQLPAETVRLKGTFRDGRFELSEGADEQMQDYFGKRTAA